MGSLQTLNRIPDIRCAEKSGRSAHDREGSIRVADADQGLGGSSNVRTLRRRAAVNRLASHPEGERIRLPS